MHPSVYFKCLFYNSKKVTVQFWYISSSSQLFNSFLQTDSMSCKSDSVDMVIPSVERGMCQLNESSCLLDKFELRALPHLSHQLPADDKTCRIHSHPVKSCSFDFMWTLPRLLYSHIDHKKHPAYLNKGSRNRNIAMEPFWNICKIALIIIEGRYGKASWDPKKSSWQTCLECMPQIGGLHRKQKQKKTRHMI